MFLSSPTTAAIVRAPSSVVLLSVTVAVAVVAPWCNENDLLRPHFGQLAVLAFAVHQLALNDHVEALLEPLLADPHERVAVNVHLHPGRDCATTRPAVARNFERAVV